MMLEARWPNANTDEWLAYERAAAEPGTDYEGIVASGYLLVNYVGQRSCCGLGVSGIMRLE